ncbi:MAG: GGDEF domain-containing protein [Halanaerobiales bacterium]
MIIEEKGIESRINSFINEYADILDFLTMDIFLITKQDDTYRFLINEGPIADSLGITTKKISKGIDKVIGTSFTDKLSKYYQRAFNGHAVKYRVKMKGIVFETLLLPVYENDNIEYILGISRDLTKVEKLLDENDSLKVELSNALKKDCIVDAYNRDALKKILIREINKVDNDNQLAVILFDIDRLNNVNDVYGHTVGDKIIVQTSTLCGQNIRRSDYFGRWTGGQFVVVAPHSSQKGIMRLAERLKMKISNFDFINNIKLTASFGVVVTTKNIGFDKLIWNVEKAMQKAKRIGKNNIVLESIE